MPIYGEAKREYACLWIANRRKAFFSDKTCKTCGASDKLELHHRDPALKVSHRIWSWSKLRRDVEISKCDVLCTVCHMEETKKKFTKLVHGAWNAYDKGCRCLPCRVFRARKIREQRAKKKYLGVV